MPKNYKHIKDDYIIKHIKDDYVNWCINIEAKNICKKTD